MEKIREVYKRIYSQEGFYFILLFGITCHPLADPLATWELDSVILVGPFQLSYSMILCRSCLALLRVLFMDVCYSNQPKFPTSSRISCSGTLLWARGLIILHKNMYIQLLSSDSHVRMLEDCVQETIHEHNKLAANSDQWVYC